MPMRWPRPSIEGRRDPPDPNAFIDRYIQSFAADYSSLLTYDSPARAERPHHRAERPEPLRPSLHGRASAARPSLDPAACSRLRHGGGRTRRRRTARSCWIFLRCPLVPGRQLFLGWLPSRRFRICVHRWRDPAGHQRRIVAHARIVVRANGTRQLTGGAKAPPAHCPSRG